MSWFSKALKTCGKAIGSGVKVVTSPIGAIGKEIKKIPVVGGALSATYNLTLNAPFKVAHNIADGKRLDRVAVGHFKGQLADAKTVAPYAQTVVSFVPGVGQGISAAIGTGLALSEGRPLSEALVAAIKGAVPGGPIAQSAFSIAASAAQGKPIDQIALSALPISDAQKTALLTVTNLGRDLAAGKRVDESVFNRVKSLLPTELGAALNTGIAVGKGKSLQDSVVKNMSPVILKSLAVTGKDIASKNAVFNAGQSILKSQPAVSAGYNVGIAFASKKVRPIDMIAVRKKLTGAQKKGFDMALSAHVGMVTRPPSTSGKHDPKAQFGYYVTHGMRQATPKHKTAMMREIVKEPIARTGAVAAIKEVQWTVAPWWKRILSELGIQIQS
jgi:hypothetical protein